ncbi:MAG: hypothetical protein ABSB15_00515 [Bryobacteraceae bacterium]
MGRSVAEAFRERTGVCRDYAHLAIATTFGPGTLESFRVWADEIPAVFGQMPLQA